MYVLLCFYDNLRYYVYCATKCQVSSLTKYQNYEYRPYGLRAAGVLIWVTLRRFQKILKNRAAC